MENQIWLAIIALVASVMAITEFFKRLIKVDKKWVNRLLTFIVAEGTAFVAWILGKLPTFFTPEWACVLVEGGILGLLCCWTYDPKIIKEIFDIIFSLFGQKLGGKWYTKEFDNDDNN